MIRVLIAGLRATLPRLVATGLAIALSVGFVVATLTLSATFTRTTEQALTANMANADVHVTPAVAMVATSDPRTSTDLLVDLLPTIQAVDRVAAADVERLAYVELRSGDSRTVGQVTGMLAEPVRWQKLAGGAWPQLATEATLDQASATSLGVTVGDSVSLKAVGAAVRPSDVTIVGITSTAANGAGTGAPALMMTPDALTDPAMFAVSTGVLVKGDGTPGSALAAAVTDATSGSSGLVVQTKAEAVDYQTAQLSGSASVITSILLAFAIVALFVASMVIANTFQVLVAQRTKDLALLRCIGASTGQVRRLILGEAALTGAVASALGVVVGLAGAQTLAVLSRTGSSGLHLGALAIDPALLLIGFAIGMLLTVLSALPPSRQATRVRPVAALRTIDASVRVRRHVLRSIVAVVMLLVGGAGVFLGATRFGLPVAVAAGVVSFLGVLLASVVIIPQVVRAVGLTIAWISAPARLASLNATRNPARTASTAAALLIGVTLVTMMVVGVTSVRVSVNDKIDEKRPIDLTVQTINAEGLSPDQVAGITALQGIEESTVVSTGRLTISPEGGAAFSLPAHGIDPEGATRVARAAATVPEPGKILLNPADAGGIRTGQSVTVAGDLSSRSFLVDVTEHARLKQATISSVDLAALIADPIERKVQLRLADEVTGGQVQQISTNVLSIGDDLRVGGGAPERTYYVQILDVMLLIVLALLTIAVVIAVVGVGNTLALSVIERRRESGLLRALGLTRGQLRAMFSVEAVLITVVAALCGIGLGIVYAWAGLSAVALEARKLSLGIHLPWSQLAVILAGALLAGLVASVIPSLAAARRSPMDGLAGN